MKKRFKPFYYVYLILFIIAIVEKIYMPNALILLHSTAVFPYWRMRLLTTEASFVTLQIVFFFLTSFYYAFTLLHSKVKSVFVILIFLFFAFETQSKSLLVLIAILILYLLFLYMHKMTPKKFLLFAVVAVISLFAITRIVSLFTILIGDSFSQSTSFSTRTYSILTGFITGMNYPFGTGGSSYLFIYPKILEEYIWIPQSYKFELSEIYTFINATSDENIAVKSGFFGFFMKFGIIGTVYFFTNYYLLVKNNIKNRILKICIFLIIVGITCFVAIETEFWLTIVVSLFFSYDKKKKKSKDFCIVSNNTMMNCC